MRAASASHGIEIAERRRRELLDRDVEEHERDEAEQEGPQRREREPFHPRADSRGAGKAPAPRGRKPHAGRDRDQDRPEHAGGDRDVAIGGDSARQRRQRQRHHEQHHDEVADHRNQRRSEHGVEALSGELAETDEEGGVREWVADRAQQLRAATHGDHRPDRHVCDEAPQRDRLEHRPDQEEGQRSAAAKATKAGTLAASAALRSRCQSVAQPNT